MTDDEREDADFAAAESQGFARGIEAAAKWHEMMYADIMRQMAPLPNFSTQPERPHLAVNAMVHDISATAIRALAKEGAR